MLMLLKKLIISLEILIKYKVIKLILLGNAETNEDIFDLMLKMFDPKFIIAQIIFLFQLYDQKFYCSDMLQSEHI